MERVFRHARVLLTRVCLVLWAAVAVVGCHQAAKNSDCKTCKDKSRCWDLVHVDNCSDIPQGAIPLPIGTYTTAQFNTQAEKAEADDFVIYYNEWLDNTAMPGPYGADHIARIIQRLPIVPFPVVVQPEIDHPSLTALRHKFVVEALTNAGIPDALNRVVIARPAAEGLFGEEAQRIYPKLIMGGMMGMMGGGMMGGGMMGGGMMGGGMMGGGFGGFGGGGFGFR